MYLNPIDLQKIPVVETNVQVSRKSKKTNQIPPSPWRAFVPKNALAPVLLCKLALYESCIGASATPQGNEIRASEENSSNFMPKLFGSVNFSWNSWKTTFPCTAVILAFLLPHTIACSNFSIYGCISTRLTYKKYRLSKRMCRFRENQRKPPEKYQEHVGHSFAKSPSPRYYSAS